MTERAQLAAAAEKQNLGVSLPFWTWSRPIHHPMSPRLLLLLRVVASSWSYSAAVVTRAWRYERQRVSARANRCVCLGKGGVRPLFSTPQLMAPVIQYM